MQEWKKYVQKALSRGMTHAKVISTKNVVVANWVRLKCQYGCGVYGKRLTCPPYSPTPDYTRKMVDEYSSALLMQIEKISPRKEAKMSRALRSLVSEIERDFFLDGYYKAFGMASGPCHLCRACDTQRPCKYPYEARPAMEACGIDVYATVRNSGLVLDVVKTEADSCTYNGLILIK